MIFKPVLIEKILAGEKTVTRRPVKGPCSYNVGQEYAIQPGMGRVTVGRIKVLSVSEIHLAEIDDDDATSEGFESAGDFAAYWSQLYDGVFDPDMKVWRIEFELVQGTHEICKCCNGLGAVPTRDGGTEG